jgi:hypothetical protein
MARDNFTKPVKLALAKRAGFRCSFPGCNAITTGPSSEGSGATANTGEAAHIAAASSGTNSRRYDPNMTSAQRSAIENGIWCCNVHAELIDTDEVTYTVPLLQHWRELAERRAQIRQAYGDIDLSLGHGELRTIGLAPESISLNSASELNQAIGAAVRYACIADIAGKIVADTLRDFLIEYVRNALTHGDASEVAIAIENKSIKVTDQGAPFQVTRLLDTTARGGGLAYRALLATARIGSVSCRRLTTGENHLHIPFVTSPHDIPMANPCAMTIDRAQVRSGPIDFTPVRNCDRVYFVAPDFSVYSDGPLFERALRQVISEHPNVVLVFPDISDRVLEHFRQIFTPAEVVTW